MLQYGSGLEDEDDDGACVLSDKWTYERESGRWSHVDTMSASAAVSPVGGAVHTLGSGTGTSPSSCQRMRSCSSRDSVMTDDTTGEETGDSASPLLHSKNNNNQHHHHHNHTGGGGGGLRVKISLPNTDVSSTHSETSGSNISPKVCFGYFAFWMTFWGLAKLLVFHLHV